MNNINLPDTHELLATTHQIEELERLLPKQKKTPKCLPEAFPMDPWLTSDDEAFNHLVDAVGRLLRQNSPKKRYRQERAENLRLLLANLFIAYDQEPGKPIKYYRTPKGYSQHSCYRPDFISAKVIRPLVDGLEDIGLVHNETGYKDIASSKGAMSTVHATEHLGKMFDGFGLYTHLFKRGQERPLVILKSRKIGAEKRRTLIEYPRNWPPIVEMNQFLRSYNAFLSSKIIRIDIPRADHGTYFREAVGAGDDEGDLDCPGTWYDQSSNALHRVFTDVDPERLNLDRLGRFYGGRWQNVKSEIRSTIQIDREPTVELDYSAFHIGMIYHLSGIAYDGDLYKVPSVYAAAGDFDSGVLRKTIKTLTNILINSTKRQISEAEKAPREELCEKWEIELPNHLSVKNMVEMIINHHSAVSRFINSGIGKMLQNKDAIICEKILHDGLENGVVILPIHDSFIVKQTEAQRLEEWMIKAYREVVGAFDPKIKAKGPEGKQAVTYH